MRFFSNPVDYIPLSNPAVADVNKIRLASENWLKIRNFHFLDVLLEFGFRLKVENWFEDKKIKYFLGVWISAKHRGLPDATIAVTCVQLKAQFDEEAEKRKELLEEKSKQNDDQREVKKELEAIEEKMKIMKKKFMETREGLVGEIMKISQVSQMTTTENKKMKEKMKEKDEEIEEKKGEIRRQEEENRNMKDEIEILRKRIKEFEKNK